MRNNQHHRAFTLIESVISLSIATVLLTGIGSSILLASRALPGADNLLAENMRTTAIAQNITTDLSTAIAFTTGTASLLEFTVADRDNDGLVETIRYGWSGTPGAPLIYRYNLEPSVVLTTLDDFAVTYELDPPPPAVESR